jgi:glutamyl-tRNA synthetase
VTLAPEIERQLRRLALDNALQHGGAARPGPIVSRLLSGDPALRRASTEIETRARAIVEEVNALSSGDQATSLAALGGAIPVAAREGPEAEELPELPAAERGKVVLRLAPFPSGALHIGNARMAFVNDYYRERYDGRLLLVFDDTVGSEEKRVEPEFFDLIRGDLDLLGVRIDATLYKSDRLAYHYAWAERVIERGGAYVCMCPADRLRENRRLGVACPERDQDVATTQAEWKRMLSGAYAAGAAVLRLRTDLQDPDPAFRDRVLLRISDIDHPRVGRKYRVWPLLEFSWAVDDVELGVTHVLRGKDLVMEDRMQSYLWNLLGVTGPPFLHFGLLRVREAKVSKSKGYREVASGAYDGWADPRLWSLRSLDRRGIRPEALRHFELSFGLSLADIEVPAETLYAENRALIDPTTPRRAFVPEPVLVRVESFPESLAEVSLPNHPDRPELGRRLVRTGPEFWLPAHDLAAHAGEEIRLKDLANIQLPPSPPPGADSAWVARFTSRENRRLPRIQWVGATGAVEVRMLQLDGSVVTGMGEAALLEATPRDHLQFERVGFVRVEADWTPRQSPVRVCYGHP